VYSHKTMSSSYSEQRFRSQVDAALVKVKRILDTTRDPTYPADVPHKYEDKYMLANFTTNTALAAQLTCLELLALTGEQLLQLKKWSANRTLTLRFKADHKCVFDRKVTKDVESATKYVTEYKVAGFTTGKHTDKVVTKVDEYFWTFTANWELFIYQGADPNDRVLLQSRKSTFEIVTGSDTSPQPSSSVQPSQDVTVTWLFQNLSDQFALNFAIDRLSKSCRTPRRNPQIETALSFFQNYSYWCNGVSSYFRNTLFPIQTNHGLDVGKINASETFVPVVPLFEESAATRARNSCEEKALVSVARDGDSDAVLQIGDVNHFLVEQKRSLLAKLGEMEKMFPDAKKGKLISAQEANVLVVLAHGQQICQHFADGIQYVEEMLRRQLIAAIGKEVQTTDFANYMLYHNKNLYKEEYAPRAFCYAVRRPDHDPEGLVSIEATIGGDMFEPIQTVVNRQPAVKNLYLQLNAATKLYFGGNRFLHGWVSQQFSGNSGLRLQLTARARQFSSFIFLIGTVASADEFEPKYAMLVQNKDDLKIPLNLENIPTPKEFNDSISSLSPEQQRFCKAYRSMQLASTLFGICVIQIKPQLEKLLNLPNDSLTKEIRLCQDLMELFIKYQIPADLLSYEGSKKADTEKKVQTVKKHVAAMQEMIAYSKANELAEARQELAMAKALVSDPFASVVAVTHSLIERPNYGRQVQQVKGGSQSSQKDQQKPQAVDDPEDYTKIPKKLDKSFQDLDEDHALHSTIISASEAWQQTHQESLLAAPAVRTMVPRHLTEEKNKAYDLLDALTRSGVISIDSADLHIVLAATHCFDSSLMDTVIRENVNPIEKVERSNLIVASTVHGKPVSELLRPDHVKRVQEFSKILFLEDKK